MQCPRCQHENPTGTKFCGECAAPLASTCPSCGAANPPESNGSVEYRGRRYDVPSKLAGAVINTNGGKTEALNGYDYLFIRSSNWPVPLHKLRDGFLRRTT